MSLSEPGAAGATGPGIGSVLPAEPEEAAVADEPKEAAVAESAVPCFLEIRHVYMSIVRLSFTLLLELSSLDA